MGTIAVLSIELPCLESCLGDGVPITKLLPPEDPLLRAPGGPSRPPAEALAASTSWFITVIWGPRVPLPVI